MVNDIEKTLDSVAKSNGKPYEPLKFEVVTFGEDIILASTFDTKGFYDGDWFIFDDVFV